MKTWDNNNTVTKNELASVYKEVGTAVTSTGQALDASGATVADTDTKQLARAIAYAGGGASMMTATGGVSDTITLTPMRTAIELPSTLALMNGFLVRFSLGTTRTSGYTITIGSLAAKSLVTATGATINANEIPLNTLMSAYYLSSTDKWYLTPESTALLKYSGGESVTLPNGLIMKSGFSNTWVKGVETGTFDGTTTSVSNGGAGGNVGSGQYTIPIAFTPVFPTGIKTVNFTVVDNFNTIMYTGVRDVTANGFTAVIQEGGSVTEAILGIYWQAIGY